MLTSRTGSDSISEFLGHLDGGSQWHTLTDTCGLRISEVVAIDAGPTGHAEQLAGFCDTGKVLHLSLRVPKEMTDDVVDLLTDDDAVTNVAVLTGCYRKPPGNMVMADVARENANLVMRDLRELGLQANGSIALTEIGTQLSDDAERIENAAPGAPEDALIWDVVEEKVTDDSRFSFAFITFLTLAALIAGVGRLEDEPILIIGAMVVGPEFSPIAAICVGLSRPRWSLLPKAVGTLLGGFAIATAIATPLWWMAHQLGMFTAERASTGQLTSFIVQPNIWSFVIALLAGMAGTLALSTDKSGALVGVFISVTTIPAVGTLSLCLAVGIWSQASGALLQLGINLLGLVLSGTGTLLLLRFLWSRVRVPDRVKKHLSRSPQHTDSLR